ncbi:unnamed protein product (macronuclear) [Paramecium tetraurelia]|uniref:Mitochondrial import inner membrane translocase subunit TIM50 n=1 Tax=Paramecium tetraurelia TaxID=5888 RepID=A0CYY1_PARTE|nr:uncharacterized protein GSPATT00011599001 [Paramecium tetraurelia]CAK75998.1 unnamed protein product [Paramecium tetraurelia]|eukprot:XP_001443395.1 hypothetical protein (macronuclear) [Paramecium tetraurelia strain d4-2]
MRIAQHSKSCQVLQHKKIFTFNDEELINTSESTPNSSGNTEKPQLLVFRNQIMPDSQIARELHEASIQSHWYVETPKEYVDKRVVKLKKQKLEKVVVLDLDETLIYYKPNQTIVRPFCQEFLERLSRICILVLFTAAKKEHAINMLKIIDPNKKYFKAICTSDHNDWQYIVIVENSPKNFVAQINNGIPIIPFEGQQNDNQLELLLSFLEIVLLVDDVRVQLANIFKLQYFYKELNGKQAINKLYNLKKNQ